MTKRICFSFLKPRVILAALQFSGLVLHAEDWPMLGRDKTRNPVSPEKGAPVEWDTKTGRNIKWKARLGSMTFAAPVVANGLVWIGTNNGNPRDSRQTNSAGVLMCFRESDGRFLYQHVSPARRGALDRQALTGNPNSPLIEGDRLWFVTTRGEVVCLDIGPLQRGEGAPSELWKLDMVDELGVSPRTAVMGGGGICSIAASFRERIYVITGNGTGWDNRPANPRATALVCLNRNTGQILWEDNSSSKNVLFGEWGSPLVIEINEHGQVVAPQGDGWLRSFDALTGELIWKFDINPKNAKWLDRRGIFTTPPVFYGNRIYIALGNYMEWGEGPGRLVCIDPTRSGDLSLELDDGPGKTKPNPKSGAVWHFDQFHRTMAMVAIHEGLVIAPDFGGLVHCLDADTGRINWTHDLRAEVLSSPLIADGKVYFGDGDGNLTIFALSKTNRVIARLSMTTNYWLSSSPIFANGVLYLAAGEELYAIGEQSGSWPQWRGADHLLEHQPRSPPSSGVDLAPDAVFIPTPQDIVEKMLEVASVRKSDSVVDLGSGDGRVVITAAKLYSAKSIGYKIAERLVEQSRENIAKEGLQSLARIEHADLFTVNLKEADVIFVFLYPQLMERLLPRFDQLKPGSRIVSHQFEIPGVKPDRELVVPSKEDGDKHRILLWTTPLKKN